MIKAKGKHTQFYEASELPKGVVIMPERSMLAAYLVRNYEDIYIYKERIENPVPKQETWDTIEYPRDARRQLEKLLDWFKSDSSDPFSLLWTCYHFDPTWQNLPSLMRKAITKPRTKHFLTMFKRI